MLALEAFLNDLDFSFKINEDNTLSLIDLQQANLANIEQEKFTVNDSLPTNLINALDRYVYDYILQPVEETLQKECKDSSPVFPADTNLIPLVKKYPHVFPKEHVEYLQDIINANIDISQAKALTKAK